MAAKDYARFAKFRCASPSGVRHILPGKYFPVNEPFMRGGALSAHDEIIGARMIKVGGPGGAGGARRTGGAGASRASSGGAFKVDGASGSSATSGASAASDVASASALGALIALQSEGRNGARNRAMAERALMLLERIRDGLVEGRIIASDLAALADAADAKLTDPDEKIAAIYAEISLRAKVELAKMGR